MMKVYGKIVKDNKIIKDLITSSDIDGEYQDNLKLCIIELCTKFDIEKPYWLPGNVKEFNSRNKVIFDSNNFIDEIDFDKFVVEDVPLKP